MSCYKKKNAREVCINIGQSFLANFNLAVKQFIEYDHGITSNSYKEFCNRLSILIENIKDINITEENTISPFYKPKDERKLYTYEIIDWFIKAGYQKINDIMVDKWVDLYYNFTIDILINIDTEYDVERNLARFISRYVDNVYIG